MEKVREEERGRSQEWAEDLRRRFIVEKQALEEKVARLEARGTLRASASGLDKSSETPASDSSTVGPVVPVSTTTSVSTPATSSVPVGTSASSTATSTSTGVTTSTSATSSVLSVGSAEMIAKLFETQSQILAAQVQAATLPPLTSFEGQHDVDDVDFEQWIE